MPGDYQSRWETCEVCGCTTIVENNKGVPDPDDWVTFTECTVCGESINLGNADEQRVSDRSWGQGRAHGIDLVLRVVDGFMAEQEEAASDAKYPAPVAGERFVSNQQRKVMVGLLRERLETFRG